MSDNEQDEMLEMSEYQLTLLAMKAFLFIHKNNQETDEKLLANIIAWFELMSAESELEVTEVEMEPDGDVEYINPNRNKMN